MSEEVSIRPAGEHVSLVEFSCPPHNYFDAALIEAIADAYEELDRGGSCRAIVLCSEGKNFCAGANFGGPNPADGPSTSTRCGCSPRDSRWSPPSRGGDRRRPGRGALGRLPRVARPGSRFSANFARLGIHHGFGVTVTLPLVVGHQRSLELLYTGVRVRGEDAHAISLCDRLVADERIREEAVALAEEIAISSPLAVKAIRRTMAETCPTGSGPPRRARGPSQAGLFATEDFREGVAAASERRAPRFSGR